MALSSKWSDDFRGGLPALVILIRHAYDWQGIEFYDRSVREVQMVQPYNTLCPESFTGAGCSEYLEGWDIRIIRCSSECPLDARNSRNCPVDTVFFHCKAISLFEIHNAPDRDACYTAYDVSTWIW